MKHRGKPGKRSGPTGYRTASSFLHHKAAENARRRTALRKQDRKGVR